MASISLSSQTTLQDINNFFGFALYDAQPILGSPLEVITPPKPYGNPLQIAFTYNCIIGRQYIVRIWESADGSATGVVRNQWAGSVNGQSILVRPVEYLKVGVTIGMNANDTDYDNASWQGWDYKMERNSKVYIPDDPGVDGIPHYHKKSTGGFALLPGISPMSDGEDWCVTFEAQVINNVTGQPSNVFGTGQVITDDTDFDGSYTDQALAIQATANKITCKFPSLALVPAYSWIYIYSNGGNHINATFEMDGTDKFFYNGQLLSQVILGQGEIIKAFKAPFGPSGEDVWFMDTELAGWDDCGTIIFSEKLGIKNTLQCIGQLLQRSEYPRLWKFIQSLSGAALVNDTSWNSFTVIDGLNVYTNRYKFSTGDGSTTFRLPDLRDAIFKGVNGSTLLPGTMQLPNVGKHQHWLFQDTTQTNNNIPSAGDSVAVVGASGGDYHYAMKEGDPGIHATLGVTSNPVINDGTTALSDTENKVRTASHYFLIKY